MKNKTFTIFHNKFDDIVHVMIRQANERDYKQSYLLGLATKYMKKFYFNVKEIKIFGQVDALNPQNGKVTVFKYQIIR
jgi:hypothetical protein